MIRIGANEPRTSAIPFTFTRVTAPLLLDTVASPGMFAASTSAKLVRRVAAPRTSRTRIRPFEFSTSGAPVSVTSTPPKELRTFTVPETLARATSPFWFWISSVPVTPRTAMRPNEPVIWLLPPASSTKISPFEEVTVTGPLTRCAETGPNRFFTLSGPSMSMAVTGPFEPVTSVSPPPTRDTSIAPKELSMRWPPRQSRTETRPLAFEIVLAARAPASSTSPNLSRIETGAVSGTTIV